ncbi:B-cell receptor CD22-like [Acanthochromis polyacanthus]|uniref:B-cell receptor CD22-like n=1 Tax=Acanthochromis polyacanthus TaxID=80966 RepID=UPI002234DD5B|nr:B-cell receptor CD22-like [Acanthochromis polyacanthus]
MAAKALEKLQDDWGVTFTSTQICVVKGSTVEMSCNYKHPTYMDGYYLTVQKTFWFKDSVDLTTDEAYTDRVEYRYAPKRPSLSVSPSAEIMEGSSVTLTCSSDANPAANYTWYKRNGNPALQSLSNESQLIFSSIQSSDSGLYYCTVENVLGKRTSGDFGIDVKCEYSS